MDNNIEKLVQINFQPYKKKMYLFSITELNFYDTLKKTISNDYYIYPKVRVCDIVEATGKNAYFDFNKIKSKHVDFLICTKDPISTKMVIELDDKSHEIAKRKKRDNFMNEVFGNAGIPIAHIRVQRSYNGEILKEEIKDALRTKYIIKGEEIKENNKPTVEKAKKSPGCGDLAIAVILIIIWTI